jgi:ABC-type transport system substrate-binding protein
MELTQEKIDRLVEEELIPDSFHLNELTPTTKGVTEHVINVGWHSYPDATGYKVYRSVNGGSFSLRFQNEPTTSYTYAHQIVEVVGGQTITDINFDLLSEVSADQLGGIYYLGFNLDMPPFDNIKVRQALNYAIDKQTLVDEFNAEFGLDREVAQGPIPPSMIGYNPSLVGYTYDINQAEVLLSQAGYPDGFSADLYFNENTEHRFIAEKIKIYLAQIGVDVEIHGIEDWNSYVSMVTEGELPFFRLGWIADTPDPTDLLYALYHTEGHANHVHHYNSIVDSQIEQAWEIIDNISFVQLIQQIETIIVGEALAIFLYYY